MGKFVGKVRLGRKMGRCVGEGRVRKVDRWVGW